MPIAHKTLFHAPAQRYLTSQIRKDLKRKIVLLAGPRQVGKTTLARALTQDCAYLNYDVASHRKTLLEQSWRRDVALVIFDELHKLPRWKSWLKGIYDGEGLTPAVLVTGSARLDIARKVGDSLAGRHFLFHLHPFDLKELATPHHAPQLLDRLMTVGGFPEPFLTPEAAFAGRWRKSHIDIVLRQDLLDLENVRQISQMETLIELLRGRVGSPVSAQALAEDLSVNDTTVRRWLKILENLFILFRVSPWHKNIARGLKKAPKYYFYDNGLVLGGAGPAFENLVACALLKEVDYQRNVGGRELELRYLRNRQGDEIDFAIVEKGRLTTMIEAKWRDDEVSRSFKKLAPQREKSPAAIQLVGKGARDRDMPYGVKVRDAAQFLCKLSL